MEHAESAALRDRFDSVYLYTHEKATENIALYARVGYVSTSGARWETSRSCSCESPSAEAHVDALLVRAISSPRACGQ